MGRMLKEEVTEEDISEVISKWTGIPVSKLLESDRDKLLALSDVLHQRVIGQNEVLTTAAPFYAAFVWQSGGAVRGGLLGLHHASHAPAC